MRRLIVPGEFGQRAHRFGRWQLVQVQLLFGRADVAVGLFQHGAKERVLVVEVAVEQALVDGGAFGDAVYPRTARAVFGKRVARDGQDGNARPFSVARPGLGC